MSQHHSDHATHTVGYGIYVLVWLGLVAFTGLTVAVAFVDLRWLTIPVALSIAVAKTMLVVLYFMHVKYESGLFKGMILVCLVTFVIFIGLTFFDIAFR